MSNYEDKSHAQNLKDLITELVGEPVSLRTYLKLEVYDKNKSLLDIPNLPRVYSDKSMKEAVAIAFNHVLGVGGYTDVFMYDEPIYYITDYDYQAYVPEIDGEKSHDNKLYIRATFDEIVEYDFDPNFDGDIGIK